MLYLYWLWHIEVSTALYLAFSTKFVIYKDWHLHIFKFKLEVSESEIPNSSRDTPNISYVNEGKAKSIQNRLKWIDKSLQPQIVEHRMLKKIMMIQVGPA